MLFIIYMICNCFEKSARDAHNQHRENINSIFFSNQPSLHKKKYLQILIMYTKKLVLTQQHICLYNINYF